LLVVGCWLLVVGCWLLVVIAVLCGCSVVFVLTLVARCFLLVSKS
jgi:hypothetical protein